MPFRLFTSIRALPVCLLDVSAVRVVTAAAAGNGKTASVASAARCWPLFRSPSRSRSNRLAPKQWCRRCTATATIPASADGAGGSPPASCSRPRRRNTRHLRSRPHRRRRGRGSRNSLQRHRRRPLHRCRTVVGAGGSHQRRRRTTWPSPLAVSELGKNKRVNEPACKAGVGINLFHDPK